jgi:hypothetical protein
MFVDEKQFAPAVEQKPPAPWRKILLDAADLIEKEGWVQREYGRIGRGFCIEGAIKHIAYPSMQFDAMSEAVWAMEHHVRTANIPTWNDRLGRTKAEVLAALRAAAQGELK